LLNRPLPDLARSGRVDGCGLAQRDRHDDTAAVRMASAQRMQR